jgi:hypothetical protein
MENAVRNDPGAHGLQITLPDGFFNPTKQMGLLAKAPFKPAKSTEEKSFLRKVSSIASSFLDKNDSQNPLNEITDLVKKLNTPEDSIKLRQLIGFEQDYLDHAIKGLEKEMDIIKKETRAKAKAIPQTGTAAPNMAHQEKQHMLISLKALNKLKLNPYEHLNSLLDDELKDNSQNKDPPQIYAITQLITCLNNPDQLQAIQKRLDELTNAKPNTYDYCNTILVLQQLKTKALSENLKNYNKLINNSDITVEQENSLSKTIHYEVNRVTRVLATLETDNKGSSHNDYIAQITSYKNELNNIVKEINSRKIASKTYGVQTPHDSKRQARVFTREAQSSPTARPDLESSKPTVSPLPAAASPTLPQRGWSPARPPRELPLQINAQNPIHHMVPNISSAPLPPPPGAEVLASLHGNKIVLPPPPAPITSPPSQLANSSRARTQNATPPRLRAATYIKDETKNTQRKGSGAPPIEISTQRNRSSTGTSTQDSAKHSVDIPIPRSPSPSGTGT